MTLECITFTGCISRVSGAQGFRCPVSPDPELPGYSDETLVSTPANRTRLPPPPSFLLLSSCQTQPQWLSNIISPCTHRPWQCPQTCPQREPVTMTSNSWQPVCSPKPTAALSTPESSAKPEGEHRQHMFCRKPQKVPLTGYLKQIRLPRSVDSYTGTVSGGPSQWEGWLRPGTLKPRVTGGSHLL